MNSKIFWNFNLISNKETFFDFNGEWGDHDSWASYQFQLSPMGYDRFDNAPTVMIYQNIKILFLINSLY